MVDQKTKELQKARESLARGRYEVSKIPLNDQMERLHNWEIYAEM